ncbi:hypothetical protein [Mesorhizobium sp. M0520]|uniref:hypothetical protein n=1 Tax=Mesorhizobium sp. M0520 TaxID=2956957 RepID=UPI003337B092
MLEALTPDKIAIAALGQIEEETRQLERQWALRRERARYEAERARRQYDAVEPENRRGRVRWSACVGRKAARRSARHVAVAFDNGGRAQGILRLIVCEVILDQKRFPGQVGSRSYGRRKRQGSTPCKYGSTPMAITPIWSGCGAA